MQSRESSYGSGKNLETWGRQQINPVGFAPLAIYITNSQPQNSPRRRSGPRMEGLPHGLPLTSPDRSSAIQIPGMVYEGYPAAPRDYSYYGGGSVKRARTSMDYGSIRDIYDVDGRMVRQMDAYSQAASMYPNQTAAYQTTQPVIQGYATTAATPRPTALATATAEYTLPQPSHFASTTAPHYSAPQDAKVPTSSWNSSPQDTKIPPSSWNWMDFSRSTR